LGDETTGVVNDGGETGGGVAVVEAQGALGEAAEKQGLPGTPDE
jgi:hypothetical protein